ncbi:MAG: hypothetical protein LIP09_16625 [Bacteroidales bacterium]|nr:hypothetical protein [Bacteroidales bacterium]
MIQPISDWNATGFFKNLTAQNLLASAEDFTFCQVSGLDGFEEVLHPLKIIRNQDQNG